MIYLKINLEENEATETKWFTFKKFKKAVSERKCVPHEYFTELVELENVIYDNNCGVFHALFKILISKYKKTDYKSHTGKCYFNGVEIDIN